MNGRAAITERGPSCGMGYSKRHCCRMLQSNRSDDWKFSNAHRGAAADVLVVVGVIAVGDVAVLVGRQQALSRARQRGQLVARCLRGAIGLVLRSHVQAMGS